jgi:predicted phage terminase large subunit-like protein
MVIGVWARTPLKDLLLLEVIRGRWDHNAQQDEIEDAFKEHEVEFVAVETVNYQHALFQDLVVKGIPCMPFTPYKDKVARAGTASIWQGNGKIYFLADAKWLPELQKELYKFPKAPHDDQVDMVSLASIVVRSRGPLSDDATDEEDIPAPAELTGGLLPLTVPLKASEDEQAAAAQVLISAPQKPVDPFAWAEKQWGGDW